MTRKRGNQWKVERIKGGGGQLRLVPKFLICPVFSLSFLQPKKEKREQRYEEERGRERKSTCSHPRPRRPTLRK